jgi:hypothetical protein
MSRTIPKNESQSAAVVLELGTGHCPTQVFDDRLALLGMTPVVGGIERKQPMAAWIIPALAPPETAGHRRARTVVHQDAIR